MDSIKKEVVLTEEDSKAGTLIEPVKLTELDRCLIQAYARYKERAAKQGEDDAEQINRML